MKDATTFDLEDRHEGQYSDYVVINSGVNGVGMIFSSKNGWQGEKRLNITSDMARGLAELLIDYAKDVEALAKLESVKPMVEGYEALAKLGSVKQMVEGCIEKGKREGKPFYIYAFDSTYQTLLDGGCLDPIILEKNKGLKPEQRDVYEIVDGYKRLKHYAGHFYAHMAIYKGVYILEDTNGSDPFDDDYDAEVHSGTFESYL